MAQSVIRIIYDPATYKPKRFIIPHDDDHLDKHLPEEAESHIDITNEQWGLMQAPNGPHLGLVEEYIKLWAS